MGTGRRNLSVSVEARYGHQELDRGALFARASRLKHNVGGQLGKDSQKLGMLVGGLHDVWKGIVLNCSMFGRFA